MNVFQLYIFVAEMKQISLYGSCVDFRTAFKIQFQIYSLSNIIQRGHACACYTS